MVEENKKLQAMTLGFIHACEAQGSTSSLFPKSGGWSDDDMANILFAFQLKYKKNVAMTFSNQDQNKTIAIIVNHNTPGAKFFAFDVSRARDRVATIVEKSKVLVERRNNAVGATPPGEGKETE